MNRLVMILLFVIVGITAAEKSKEMYKDDAAKVLNVEPGGSLVVKTNPGDINISSWKNNEILIKLRGVSGDGLKNLDISQNDNRVVVEFDNRWRSSSFIELNITVPEEFNLDLNTTSGEVTIRNAIIGDVSISTMGGEISTHNVTGNVDFETSGGEISTGDLIGTVRLTSQGGDLDLGNISGKVKIIETMGGDIDIRDVDADIKVTTYGGDIKMGAVTGYLESKTFGGDIQVENAGKGCMLNTFGGDIRLRKGNGELIAKTAGGNISMYQLTGSVNARTNGGEIRVELDPKGNKNSNLRSNNGEITLSMPADAKATIVAEIDLSHHSEMFASGFEIRNEFNRDTKSEYKSRKGKVTSTFDINGGGNTIEINTSNSDIKIKKLRK